MNKIKRTKITIETHDLTIIRTRDGRADLQYCRRCEEKVNVFAPDRAAFIFRVPEKLLERLFASSEIHEAGEAMLCGNSLVDYFK